VTATLDITNAGDREGTEVVQLYASYPAPDQPRRRLCGFARVTLVPGETRAVRITVPHARLALWDVAARRQSVPPGEIGIGAGASSADIRRTAVLAIPGTPSVRTGQVDAADFDDYENITLVDRTHADGTAVTPAVPADRSWLAFKSVYAERAVAAVFRVSCSAPAGGRIDVWESPPVSGGRPLAGVVVPCTGGRYEWTEVVARLSLPDGVCDLYLALHGAVRLDWFRLEPG
jgi:beta-glucosidase